MGDLLSLVIPYFILQYLLYYIINRTPQLTLLCMNLTFPSRLGVCFPAHPSTAAHASSWHGWTSVTWTQTGRRVRRISSSVTVTQASRVLFRSDQIAHISAACEVLTLHFLQIKTAISWINKDFSLLNTINYVIIMKVYLRQLSKNI